VGDGGASARVLMWGSGTPRDRLPELEVERRMTLEITEVRISLREDDKLKAFASMTFNDAFVIRGLKIIEGTNGMFVAMPSRKRPDGTYQDVAHPINNETRKFIEDRILDEYERERSKQQPSLIGTTL
jgi:stage V sporulation protein G